MSSVSMEASMIKERVVGIHERQNAAEGSAGAMGCLPHVFLRQQTGLHG